MSSLMDISMITTTRNDEDFVDVWVFNTTPTDSLESNWSLLRMTRKEAAIREIKFQPFF